MKKILSLFMLVVCFAVGANAQNAGETANGLEWSVENDVLTITGSGAINDDEAPWGTSFSTVVIGEGVTSIGTNAFKSCLNLKSVFYFGNSPIFNSWTIPNVFNGVVTSKIGFYRLLSSSAPSAIFKGYFKANSSKEILWTLLNGVFTAKSDKAMTANGDLEGINELALNDPDAMISISTISVENATVLVSENGALLSSDRSKLLLACNDDRLTVVVPETVERIGDYAFYAATYIPIVKSLSATAPELSENSFNVNYKIPQLVLPNNTPTTEVAYSKWSGYFDKIQTGDMPSSGSIDDDVYWSISNKVLTITGSGTLAYSDKLLESCSYFGVNEVRVESGITEIADNAFYENTASKYTFYYNAKISGNSGISDDATLNLQLNDDDDLALNANTFNNVTYNREFAKDATGTMIVPFTPTDVPATFKVYTLSSFSNKVMTFEQVGRVQANTPYIYKNETGQEIKLSATGEVSLNPVSDKHTAATGSGWEMHGLYKKSTVYTENNATSAADYDGNSKYWTYSSANQDNNGFGVFKNVINRVNVYPYRVYFTGLTYNEVFNNAAGGSVGAYTPERSLSVEFVDLDGTTSITEITIDGAGNIGSAVEEGVYYDLSGRRVENPTTGIYILNGKKVLVK